MPDPIQELSAVSPRGDGSDSCPANDTVNHTNFRRVSLCERHTSVDNNGQCLTTPMGKISTSRHLNGWNGAYGYHHTVTLCRLRTLRVPYHITWGMPTGEILKYLISVLFSLSLTIPRKRLSAAFAGPSWKAYTGTFSVSLIAEANDRRSRSQRT